MPRPTLQLLLRTHAVLALLVLGLGLPRILVLCEHDDGAATLAFAHASGSCCHDPTAPGTEHAPDQPGEATRGHEHCDHDDLAVELAPAPRPAAPAVPTAAPTTWCTPQDVPKPAHERAVVRPPATGPPRPDPQLRLRATTLLLL